MTFAELARKMVNQSRYEPVFYEMADAVGAKTKEENEHLEEELVNHIERALEDFEK